MKKSRRELSVDMVIHEGIFGNNQIIRSSPELPSYTEKMVLLRQHN